MLLGSRPIAPSSRQIRLAFQDTDVSGMIRWQTVGNNQRRSIQVDRRIIKLALGDVEPCDEDQASYQDIVLGPECLLLNFSCALY
jgi:hypothetical protein